MAICKFAVLIAMLLAGTAHAVCFRDGKPYPTGATVQGLVCQPNGTWKKK